MDQRTDNALNELADLFLSPASPEIDEADTELAEPVTLNEIEQLIMANLHKTAESPEPTDHAQMQQQHARTKLKLSSAELLSSPIQIELPPNTPETPNTPGTPGTPNTSETHGTHGTSYTHNTPRTPVTPGSVGSMDSVNGHDSASQANENMSVSQAKARPTDSPHLRLVGDEISTSDAQSPVIPTLKNPPRVQGMLVGHLPGFAYAWVSQYAHELLMHAEDREQCATVCHMDLAGIALERIIRGPVQQKTELSGTSDEILAELSCSARHWLLCPAMDEPRTWPRIAPLTRDWTLLTATDEVSTLHAVQLIKQLMQMPREDANLPPRIAVMFCGSPLDTAQRAYEKLRGLCEAQLDVTPALAGVRQRMQPVTIDDLGQYFEDSDHAAGHDHLWQQVTQAIHPLRNPVQSPEPPVPQPPQDEDGDDADAGASMDHALHDVADDVEPDMADDADSDVDADIQADVDAHLCAGISGLVALQARCPRDAAVELAMDEQGDLHLLAEVTEGAAMKHLAALAMVRSWAAEHAKLLEMTRPELVIESEKHIHLHLISDEAKQLTPLLREPMDVALHLRIADTHTCKFIDLN